MRIKFFTIVAVVLVSLMAYVLYKDLSKMKEEISGLKKEKVLPKPKVEKVSRPKSKPKSRPKSKAKKTAKKDCGEKHYKVTYGRAPNVVSTPHFVPEDKDGYYQDPVTKRWYWEGD